MISRPLRSIKISDGFGVVAPLEAKLQLDLNRGSLGVLRLTFNEPARLRTVGLVADLAPGNWLADDAPCAEIFDAAMHEALGSPQTCVWSQDHRELDVPLSATATLLLGENVTTGVNTVVPAGNIAFLPTPPDFHEADLLQYHFWAGLLAREHEVLHRADIYERLRFHKYQDSLVLSITAAEFNAGVDAVFQELGEVPRVRLEIVAAVRNWLGVETTTYSNAFVRVDQAPQVVLASPANATILNSDEVEFSLQTVLLEDATCSDADRYNRIIEVDWEYKNDTTAGSLVDTVASPFVINFAPFSFEANSSHSFRATAYFAGLTPIAVVQGPAETSASCAFFVTAEVQMDLRIARGILSGGTAACSTLTGDTETLTVPGRTLEVLVWRRDQTEADAGQASVTVTLNFFGLPPVLIATPWLNGSRAGPTAVVSGSDLCTVPPLTSWIWVLTESEPEGTGNQTYSELIIPVFDGSQMVRGSYYEYVMLFGSSVVFQDLRGGAYATVATAVSAGGMQAVRSNRFLADGPPQPRAEDAVNVTPAEGYAVVTTFEFTTEGWQDEQPSLLEYEFVDFALDDLLRLASPWDTNAAVYIAYSIKPYDPGIPCDHLGASSATGLMGPLVSQPVGGVDPNVAVAALASAKAQSNAVVNAELDALQLAAEITSAESSGLKKVGDVMASTMSKGSSATDPAIVEKAADVLDTVLETALTPGAMNKDAGDSLLGSVAAMVSGSSSSSSGVSEEQKATTTSKLIGLTSKLGQSVMNSIEVNATQVLTSVGADGKGSQVVVKKQSTEDVQRLTKCGDSINFRGSAVSVSVVVPSSNSWTAADVALTSVDDDGVRASCSSTQGGGAYTVFHRNSIANESEQGGITFLAVAIALPLIVMGSAVAGGGLYMMRKRIHETKSKSKVFPVDEEAAKLSKSPSLREVVTHTPPGEPDADLPGFVNDPSPVAVERVERGNQKLQLPVAISLGSQLPCILRKRELDCFSYQFTSIRPCARERPVTLSRERDDDELSNLSNAAISELRRRSHGEIPPTPGSLSLKAFVRGCIAGNGGPESPSPDALYNWLAQNDSSSAHVIPVNVPARNGSRSREPSAEHSAAQAFYPEPTDWTSGSAAGEKVKARSGKEFVGKDGMCDSVPFAGNRYEPRASQPDKQPRITVTARRPVATAKASSRSQTPEQPNRSQVVYAQARRRSSSAAPSGSEAMSAAPDRRDSMARSQVQANIETNLMSIGMFLFDAGESGVGKLRRAEEASGLQSPTNSLEPGFPTLLMKGAVGLSVTSSPRAERMADGLGHGAGLGSEA
ncbi:hypothetical protein AK812_SmicGene11000 [Symbiodinium microadriaticum]|uniref:PKD/REJ-like domain-containing protein n=1 Tax=Symbiodinium microadriaticum TaxID=2951 RepID=A0A1Q9EE89_SYMMI|nr:hypothetical protein AK812_SmicGene11000 [Symbiodinium microadriaticum]